MESLDLIKGECSERETNRMEGRESKEGRKKGRKTSSLKVSFTLWGREERRKRGRKGMDGRR